MTDSNENRQGGGGNRPGNSNRSKHKNSPKFKGRRRNNRPKDDNRQASEGDGQRSNNRRPQKSHAQGQGQGQGQRQRSDGPDRNNRNRRPQARRGNRRFQRRRRLTPQEHFLRKYDLIIKEHDSARAEFFKYFDRVPMNKQEKLERLFFRAVEKLREFEDNLTDEQKAWVAEYKKVDYKEEHTYAINHELDPGQTEVSHEGDFEDPHLLKAQIERSSYEDDTEESVGTIEDYKRLKGLA